MAAPARRLLIPLLLATSLAFVECAFAQTPGKDPVGAARDLYASARYDEALAVLNDIHAPDNGASLDRKSIEQYRSLCLLALGRGSEAESAIAAVVTADPTYQPNENDASPRVRGAFSDVRRKLLPEIAASRYAEAKSAYDKKMFAVAAEKFRGVIALIDDPDMAGRQTDLRTLSAGFLDLAVAATAPPPEPPKPAAVAPATPPPPQQLDPNRVYTMYDKDVQAPAVIRQEMPRITPAMSGQASDHGVLEVIINEQGRVVQAAVRQSVHAVYDSMLLTSVRDWRYQPATWHGQPVKYRKLIQINVSR
jgi:tetratricopeptide (TPR) repeat protein